MLNGNKNMKKENENWTMTTEDMVSEKEKHGKLKHENTEHEK